MSGIDWFGFETSNNTPHVLWARNRDAVLDQVKEEGYNVIRLPSSKAMLKKDVILSDIDDPKNPDLNELTSLQVMDKIILDNHRSTPGGEPGSNGLWYTNEYSENHWILDWQKLVRRYKYIPAVITAGLRNEPYNACWGCGDPSRDWRLAAEKAGNAILSVNPNLLIIVEGVAVHKPWFSDSNYPNNLPAVWDKYWSFLVKENIAPVLIGQFGTRLETEKDQQWLSQFQKYVRPNKISWTYWSLSPNSVDTGGLLRDDWVTIDQTKQNLLRQIQYPFITQFASLPEK